MACVQPEDLLNDFLFGPPGSGTLLHVDFPPLRVCILCVLGVKLVCMWEGNPRDIPAHIRSHSPGRAPYSRAEFDAVAQWCCENGGRLQILHPGECTIASHLRLPATADHVVLQVTCATFLLAGGTLLSTRSCVFL
jgi:hypothetical protein